MVESVMSAQDWYRDLPSGRLSPVANPTCQLWGATKRFGQFMLVVTCALLSASAASAQQSEPQYIRDYKQKGLPPIGKHIEFEDHGTFPPQPKGLQQTVGVTPDVKPDTRVATERLIAQSREVALRDPRVRSALGERFAVVGGGPVEPRKGGATAAQQAKTKLDFYSYSRNRAVTVFLTDNRVVTVATKPEGFQPAEARTEVEAAAEIVKRDPRYAEIVRDLRVRGIEASKPRGNRELYLLFYRQEDTPAVFAVRVDMIRAEVVSAKAIRR
jgi:hypothetical protein